MIYAIIYIVYVALAVAVGRLGEGHKFGAWGYFFASLLLTPFVGILLVLASDKRSPAIVVKTIEGNTEASPDDSAKET